MSLRYGAGQKAAARALLDLQSPTRALVAACMGTTERSMTEWITRYHWTYVDFRASDAREAQDRHRRGMLRGHGRNVSPALAEIDYHEALMQEERAAAEAEERCLAEAKVLPALEGEAGRLLAELRTQIRLHAGRLMQHYSRRGRALSLESVEAADMLANLAGQLETALRKAMKDMAAQPDETFYAEVIEDEIAMRAVAMMCDPESLRGVAAAIDDEVEIAAYENLAAVLEKKR